MGGGFIVREGEEDAAAEDEAAAEAPDLAFVIPADIKADIDLTDTQLGVLLGGVFVFRHALSSIRHLHLDVGDNLLLEPRSNYILEKLPKSKVEEVMLEEVPDISYLDIGGLDEQIEALRDGIPGARLAVIEGAAHLTPSESPTTFNNLVAAFLSRSDHS